MVGDYAALQERLVALVAKINEREEAEKAAKKHGMELHVVKLPRAKRGFVLLPRRWVVERSFSWATRFRRLAKDYERLPETVAGLHFVVFALLMLSKADIEQTRGVKITL